MRLNARRLMFIVAAISVSACFLSGRPRVDDQHLEITLCQMLTAPTEYTGKKIVLTARITSTKEGANLWSPACPRIGINLHVDQEFRSAPGIPELYRALALHGLGDHPVIATLTGFLDNDYFDEIRNQHRRVFKAIAASNIRQSQRVERR